jgi:hypothetical protein
MAFVCATKHRAAQRQQASCIIYRQLAIRVSPSKPWNPSTMPSTVQPYLAILVLTIDLIAAFRPGASPLPVNIPICLFDLTKVASLKRQFTTMV